jgi:hypothetical protein
MTLSPMVRDYIDARMNAALGVPLKDYIDARLEDIERARHVAHGELQTRLESMNELREQLDRQAATFISRTEHDTLCARVSDLERNRARLEGRASLSVILAAFGVAISVLSLLEKFFTK